MKQKEVAERAMELIGDVKKYDELAKNYEHYDLLHSILNTLRTEFPEASETTINSAFSRALRLLRAKSR